MTGSKSRKWKGGDPSSEPGDTVGSGTPNVKLIESDVALADDEDDGMSELRDEGDTEVLLLPIPLLVTGEVLAISLGPALGTASTGTTSDADGAGSSTTCLSRITGDRVQGG